MQRLGLLPVSGGGEISKIPLYSIQIPTRCLCRGVLDLSNLEFPSKIGTSHGEISIFRSYQLRISPKLELFTEYLAILDTTNIGFYQPPPNWNFHQEFSNFEYEQLRIPPPQIGTFLRELIKNLVTLDFTNLEYPLQIGTSHGELSNFRSDQPRIPSKLQLLTENVHLVTSNMINLE